MQANKHDYQYKWWVNHELNFEVASFPILQSILFIFFPTTWTVFKNRIYLFVCFLFTYSFIAVLWIEPGLGKHFTTELHF